MSHWHQKEGTVRTYFQEVNYSLRTYETDYDVGEIDADRMRFTVLSSKSPTKYDEALQSKVQPCDLVY